jgi:hypothetical protein
LKLTSDTRARLAKLIRLLGSDNAGEVAAAAHKLQAVLRSSGADLHDLAALLEEDRAAAAGGGDAPGRAPGPPRSPPPRRSQGRAGRGAGMVGVAAAFILAVGVFVGTALAVRGLTEAGPRQTVAMTAMPENSPPVIQSSPTYSTNPSLPMHELATAAPPEPALPEPAPQAQPAPPAKRAPQPKPAAAQPAAASTSEAAVPRAKPALARLEPAAETPDARNAARTAVGEMIRQMRFPQRIDEVTSMVSISAYGSEIVASYRAAVADDTIDTGQLRRLTLARACDVPIMMSALNRGATHRARYTDLSGHVAEVVISAKDCGR